MTTIERRRNARSENCRSCGKFCEAECGFLYRDTDSRTVRRLGRFGWFVKCEECHNGGKTRMTVAMEKQAASRPDEPTVRPWSVAQVKKWEVVRTTHEGDVAIRVNAASFSEVVSYRHPTCSRFAAPTGYALEQTTFAGKPLSAKAAAHLSGQILALVVAIQSEEKEAGERAAAKLRDAGAYVELRYSGIGWYVEFKGNEYTLWGQVGNTNKVAGIKLGRWIETTAEELIESA